MIEILHDYFSRLSFLYTIYNKKNRRLSMCNIITAFTLTKYIYITNTERTCICTHKGIYAHWYGDGLKFSSIWVLHQALVRMGKLIRSKIQSQVSNGLGILHQFSLYVLLSHQCLRARYLAAKWPTLKAWKQLNSYTTELANSHYSLLCTNSHRGASKPYALHHCLL